MKKTLLILSMIVALAGCERHQTYVDQTPVATGIAQPVYQQPAAPVIVNQQPSHDGTMTGALLGGMAGYMLGKHNSTSNSAPSYQPRPIIRNKTVIVNNYNKPAPTYRAPSYSAPVASPSSSRLSLSKPSSSGSSFGGFSRRK